MRHRVLWHIALLGSILAQYPAIAGAQEARDQAPVETGDAALMEWVVEEQARQDIKDTLDRYFRAFDLHDYAMLNEVFASGGKLYLGGEEIVNPGDTIALKIAELIGRNPQIPSVPEATDHFVQSVLIDLQGDHAKVESYAVAFLVVNEGGKAGTKIYVRGLHYLDNFVKVGPRQWRIKERHHNLEWMFKADATVGLALADRMKRGD